MDNHAVLKSKLYSFVKQQQTILSQSDKNEEITKALKNLHSLTGEVRTDSDVCETFIEADIIEAQKEFRNSVYERVLQYLLNSLTVDWAKTVLVGQSADLFEELFTCGANPSSALFAFGHCITENGPGYRINKCVTIVQRYLEKNQLDAVLIENCGRALKGTTSKSVCSYEKETWEGLVTIIVTLPERIINKLQSQTSVIFYPDNYVPLLCKSILVALSKVHENLTSGQECSVQFLSLLLGKLCLCGHGEMVWDNLLPSLLAHANNDYVWCRVCERFIMSVTDRCMESSLEPLLHKIPWYGCVSKFLGHAVLNNRKVRFLLTNKLILLRYFQNELVLQNIIGYVASSASLKHLYKEVFIKLLDVWGDSSAVKHTSYEQHVYITKAILICAAFMKSTDVQELQSQILNKLMTGVQVHLDSSSYDVRRLGMLTAESLTERLNINDHKLKFQYEEDEETAHLKSLIVIPEDPGLLPVQSKMQSLSVNSSGVDSSKAKDEIARSDGQERNDPDSDLDSDDDLEPYDLSNDVKVTKEKRPVYLRDCMEGLINPENPDRVEQCLHIAEKLIRQHPQSAVEISVEFSKILLNLQDNFSLVEFTVWRHGAMVALLVVAPKQVSEYLTSQVYERNYNIMQRLDVLQALADAAKELSSPESGSLGGSKPVLIQPLEERDQSNESIDWRMIVEERIESKTRRFGKGRQQPVKEAVANRFAPIAGCFFFPLLKTFDRVQSHLDLLGDDHIVLSRLIHTLGVIIYAAQHAPICVKMAQSMMEFLWAVRYHPQPFTRQAVLFAVSMVILSVPAHALVTDFSGQICEFKLWLEDVVEKDSNNECKKMALQSLVLLEKALKEEFGADKG